MWASRVAARAASLPRALALSGLVGIGFFAFAAGHASAAAPSPALRAAVERGYDQLDRDTSKLAAIMARPIVRGGAAQAKAVAAVKRMQADVAHMETQIQGAAAGSQAAIFELQAIVQLSTALTMFQTALTATSNAEAISVAKSMQAQLAMVKTSLKHGALLLGCPKTC
jgi:hypothetical protein